MTSLKHRINEWFSPLDDGFDPSKALRAELTEEIQQAIVEEDLTRAKSLSAQAGSGLKSSLTLAPLLIKNQKFAEAQEVLETVKERDRERLDYLRLKLQVSAGSGDAAQVEGTLSDLAAKHPSSDIPQAGCNAVKLLNRRGYFASGLQIAERLHQLYPKDLRVLSQLSRCMFLDGDRERALELLRPTEEDLEEAQLAHRRARQQVYAEILIEAGWLDEAFEFLKDELEADPRHWSIYYMACDCAIAAHRDLEYENLLDRQIVHHKDNVEALAIFCLWFAQQRELLKAEEHLRAIREMDERTALSVQFHLALQSEDREAIAARFEQCLKAGVPLPEVSIAYAIHLYYYHMDDGGLDEALSIVNPVLDLLADSLVAQQARLRLLVALDRSSEAAEIYRDLPTGMQQAHRLKPFDMYFRQLEGKDQDAREAWSLFISDSRHDCVNARSSYPKTISSKYNRKGGDILLFCVVFNGLEYLDWFLSHYRNLGVAHFFFTDNGSTDGTLERLMSEPDVSVFENHGSFSASAFGLLWTNHLLSTFGVGHWCFHVDIDEGFVFPGQDRGRTLHDLTAYLDARGYECVRSFMLDMYPATLATNSEADPFENCCYFDTDYGSMPSEFPPYEFTYGGLRQRLTNQALMMNKSPLVRMAPDVRYLVNNHYHTHLKTADITTALLHYKFAGAIEERLWEAIERKEHVMRARFYKTLDESLQMVDRDNPFLTEFSRQLKSVSDLEAENLITTSPDWESFGRDD